MQQGDEVNGTHYALDFSLDVMRKTDARTTRRSKVLCDKIWQTVWSSPDQKALKKFIEAVTHDNDPRITLPSHTASISYPIDTLGSVFAHAAHLAEEARPNRNQLRQFADVMIVEGIHRMKSEGLKRKSQKKSKSQEADDLETNGLQSSSEYERGARIHFFDQVRGFRHRPRRLRKQAATFAAENQLVLPSRSPAISPN